MKKYLSSLTLTCVFLAGLLTFDQYGESWDDRSLQKYAELSMQAYTTWPAQGFVEVDPQNLAFYGPFFVSFTAVTSNFLSALLPVHIADLRHLIYFLTWFAGVVAFHSIAKRFLTQIPALGATLLFVTQPLFWGHAFINPKDTPFLSLFLLSLSLGMNAFDKLEPNPPIDLSARSKRTLTLLTALWLITIFGLFVFTESIHTYIQTLVLSAQSGSTNIISLIAKNITGIPAETYIQRYFVLFLQLRAFYFLLSTSALLLVWRKLNYQLLITLITILPSAIILGFATSTRILGPYAGLLVTLYAFRNRGKQTLAALSMYAIVAMIVTYLTWPYLWTNPVRHFLSSIVEMSSYPWFGEVLFNGGRYPATELPYSYLPVLFAIQLTEPIWLLSIVGWLIAVQNKEKKRTLVQLSLAWFLIPLVAFIVLRIALYDNFRQVLFILPPIFLMAGVAFEAVKNVKWQTILIVLSLLPGIVGIVSLHPYEYIYYNSIVGGVDGAQGRFETDYWLTSYREAAEYLNQTAPPGSVIWADGPGNLFSIFASEDFDVYSWSRDQVPTKVDFVVVTTRSDAYKTVYPEAKIIHTISRGGADLAVIKKP
jgi:hypothetical protein